MSEVLKPQALKLCAFPPEKPIIQGMATAIQEDAIRVIAESGEFRITERPVRKQRYRQGV